MALPLAHVWVEVVGLSTVVSVIVLGAVLVFAVIRPGGKPEVVAAVPAAVLVTVLGLVSWPQVRHEFATLSPTVGFLAAVLVLAHLAEQEGVFGYAGGLAARVSHGSPQRLLGVVFLIASIVTAVLSLDATVVLLTPAVLAAATRIGARPKPHLYACGHLANSASLLLPVSNLTNLLAFAACGLSFARFAAVMTLPWLAVIGTEYAVFRTFFAPDLATPPHPTLAVSPVEAPRVALTVLAGVLVGFAVAEPLHVQPAWVAAAGAAVLAARRIARRPRPELVHLVQAANLPFCTFVFALGVVVLAVRANAVGALVTQLVPERPTFANLLAIAVFAAALANLLNNLPATLMLIPLVAHSPALILALLLGVNIGPNLTYVGSLATLLWRQVLHTRDHPPAAWEFLRLGALTVSSGLLLAVAALWLSLRLSGLS